MIRTSALPPVLFDLQARDEGVLKITSPEPGAVTGQAFTEESFADVIIDAELELVGGVPEDRVGLFFRQTAEQRYAACTLSGAGRLALGLVDGGPPMIIAETDLSDRPPLQTGPGLSNRLTLVTCGPVAGVMVNGVSVLGGLLDSRYVTGRVGALLVHSSNQTAVTLSVGWAQLRAIIG